MLNEPFLLAIIIVLSIVVLVAFTILITVYFMEKQSSKGYEELADAWRKQSDLNEKRLKVCEKQLELYQNAILSTEDSIRHGDKCAFLELKAALDKLERITTINDEGDS